MKRWIYLYLIMTMILGLAACGPDLEPEESCNFIQNSMDRRVSWLAQPVVVGIEDTFPEEFRESLISAMDRWDNDAIGRQVFADEIRIVKREEAESVNVALLWGDASFRPEEDEEGNTIYSNDQAKTTTASQGDAIYQALIFFNTYKQFSTQEEEKKIHMEALMIHELGHALGLGHIDDPNSVMYPKLRDNFARVDFAKVDKDSIACEY